MENENPPQPTAFDAAGEVFKEALSIEPTSSAYEIAVKFAFDQFCRTLRPSGAGATPDEKNQNSDVAESVPAQSTQTDGIESATDDDGSDYVSEETSTAALIGFLSMSFSTLGLLELISAAPASLPTISWAYQSKSAEARSGGDFGIAMELPGDKLAVAFFQAKIIGAGKELDLRRFTASNESGFAPQPYHEVLESLLLKEGRHFRDTAPKPNLGHQLVKLARTRADGWDKGDENQKAVQWVHYVVWMRDGTPPQTISLEDVLQRVRKHWKDNDSVLAKTKKRKFTQSMEIGLAAFLKDGPNPENEENILVPFSDLLSSATRAESQDSEAARWLVLSVEEAVDLIGPLLKLGQNWTLFGSNGGSAKKVQAKLPSVAASTVSEFVTHDAVPAQTPTSAYKVTPGKSKGLRV